jgi:hypothetical protein
MTSRVLHRNVEVVNAELQSVRADNVELYAKLRYFRSGTGSAADARPGVTEGGAESRSVTQCSFVLLVYFSPADMLRNTPSASTRSPSLRAMLQVPVARCSRR